MLRIVLQSLKLVTIAVMAVLVVVGGLRFFDYYRDRTAAEDLGDRVSFTVDEDETVDSVAKRLHDEGLIRYELYFEGRVRTVNADVIPGKYGLRKGMSANEIIAIVTGEAEDEPEEPRQPREEEEDEPETVQLTVIEGWRTEQIAEELVAIGWEGTVDDFIEAVEDFDVSNFEFLEGRDNPVNPDSLEGYLFPETYDIETTEPAEDIIQKMLMVFDERFTPDMRDRAEEMNLSIYEVLIFASLVEREAKLSEERPIIADVYLNRFEQGIKLDADPAARYGIGKRDGEWWDAPTAADLEDVDNPYNPYQFEGLPPGPIANPGRDSIQAVLTPGGTEYIYFVAITDDESGRHLFAFDFDSQTQNVAFVNGEAAEPAPGSDPFGGGEQIPIQPTDG